MVGKYRKDEADTHLKIINSTVWLILMSFCTFVIYQLNNNNNNKTWELDAAGILWADEVGKMKIWSNAHL